MTKTAKKVNSVVKTSIEVLLVNVVALAVGIICIIRLSIPAVIKRQANL